MGPAAALNSPPLVNKRVLADDDGDFRCFMSIAIILISDVGHFAVKLAELRRVSWNPRNRMLVFKCVVKYGHTPKPSRKYILPMAIRTCL